MIVSVSLMNIACHTQYRVLTTTELSRKTPRALRKAEGPDTSPQMARAASDGTEAAKRQKRQSQMLCTGWGGDEEPQA